MSKQILKEQIERLNRKFIDWEVEFSVYPYDCMTINELLMTFYNRINDLIGNMNLVNKMVNALYEWVVNEGLKEECLKALETWKNDGTLGNIINKEIFADLNKEIGNIKNMFSIFSLELESKLPNETDDTNRLQRTIDKAKDGDSILLPTGLVVSSTININCKKIKIYGVPTQEINTINFYHIKFNGSGNLFYTGDDPTSITFENLILQGDRSKQQTAISLYGYKCFIKNCTINKFSIGVLLKGKNHVNWWGENWFENNYIHYCGIGFKSVKDIQGTSCYDSYFLNNIVHSCDKWVDSDNFAGWSFDNNHYYSHFDDDEKHDSTRFICRDFCESSITNSYLEMENRTPYLFDLTIKNSKGGVLISDNRIFYNISENQTIEQAIFKINNNVQTDSVNITDNVYYSQTSHNTYLCYFTNASVPTYYSLVNNTFPLQKLFKSTRIDSNYELRIIQNDYNLRLSNGVVLSQWQNKKCTLVSNLNDNDLATSTDDGYQFLTEKGEIYFYKTGQGRFRVAQATEKTGIKLDNSWNLTANTQTNLIKNGDFVNINLNIESGSKADGTKICLISEGFRPKYGFEIGAITNLGEVIKLYFNVDGSVVLYNMNDKNGTKILLNTTYSII